MSHWRTTVDAIGRVVDLAEENHNKESLIVSGRFARTYVRDYWKQYCHARQSQSATTIPPFCNFIGIDRTHVSRYRLTV